MRAEVAIIGAGPAGLATAIALRRKGLSVLVLDGREPPLDKSCGEGLLPDAIASAQRLGLQLPAAQAEIAGLRFHHDGRSVEARFQSPAYGIRRTHLSQSLLDQALALGVECAWHTTATGIGGSTITTNLGEIEARWIVAADGERSRARHWLSLHRAETTQRYAFRQHFAMLPWSPFVEVHWGDRMQAYVTPLADEVGIAVISSDPHIRVADAIAAFPALTRRMRDAEPTSAERGGLTTTRALANVVRQNAALIGDASASVDAITGEGVGLAFRQAELLAQSLSLGSLEPYRRGHAALSRKVRWMSRLLLTANQHPAAASAFMRLLSHHPPLFQRLVELHTS